MTQDIAEDLGCVSCEGDRCSTNPENKVKKNDIGGLTPWT